MLPFLMYGITGLATGVQVFRLVMWAVWGKAVHPLEHVSLLGSVVLITVAFVGLWRPRPAGWGALIAARCLGGFYGAAAPGGLGRLDRDALHVELLRAGPIQERGGRRHVAGIPPVRLPPSGAAAGHDLLRDWCRSPARKTGSGAGLALSRSGEPGRQGGGRDSAVHRVPRRRGLVVLCRRRKHGDA